MTRFILWGILLLIAASATAHTSDPKPEVAASPITVQPAARESKKSLPSLQADTTKLTDTLSIPTKRPGLLRRIINYYSRSNIDRTFEKRMDWSIAPGPNYSSDVGLGLGVLVAGLYRLDRTDSITAPSNVAFYGNITTKKFVLARFMGDNFFQKNRYRVSYSGAVVYFPGAFYGVGYRDGASGYVQTIDNTMYKARLSGCMTFLPHTYIGLSLTFDYTGSKSQNKFPSRTVLDEQMAPAYDQGQLTGDGKRFYESYLTGDYIPELSTPFDNYIAKTGEKKDALNTGLGIFAQYDTRDVITSPHKGLLIKGEARYYPTWLGNSQDDFWKINFQVDFYQKLWKGMILACDLHSEFTLGTPSWHLFARIGGMDRMRGYYEGRYRDSNAVQIQVELRQRIYRRHGVVAWLGGGNMWGHDAFRWENTLHSFGCGYRFEFKNRMNIRLDYGWGVFGNPHLFWDNKRSSAFLFTASEAF